MADPFDLASYAAQMPPEQAQMIQATALRNVQNSDAFQQANQMAYRYSPLAAIAAMANNPGVAAAAKQADTDAQSQYKPLSLGQTGFALPGSGQFVESPMYMQEKQMARDQTMAMLQQTLAMRQAEIDQRAEANRNSVEQRAEAAQQHYALGGIMAQIAQQRADNQQQMLQAQLQNRDQNHIQQYANGLSRDNIPAAYTGLQLVSNMMQRYPQGDIPGFGSVTNAMPNWMMSQEGQGNRTDMQAVANQLLKSLSGLAVSNEENKRFLTQIGQGVGMNADQLRRGWANTYTELMGKIQNRQGQLNPNQKQQYIDQGGQTFDTSTPGWVADIQKLQQPGAANQPQVAAPGDKWLPKPGQPQ